MDAMPGFKASLRHRLAMKRIFALFEKKTSVAASDPPKLCAPQNKRLRSSKRLIILFAVIACAALLTGFIVVYFSKAFRGTVYPDNTELFPINTENCPTTNEYEYYLPEVPDGFHKVEYDALSSSVYTEYKNEQSGNIITFTQYTKDHFIVSCDNERHVFE